ncbi:uncharacterized protein [Typha angustifolia]|uniref:uncharacterized protein n=1 Tax=Typha angustifolia TaxID=59011 RepID=UPI003C2C46FF
MGTVQLLCHFDGKVESKEKKVTYIGGTCKLLDVPRDTSYEQLKSHFCELMHGDPQDFDVELRYLYPTEAFESFVDVQDDRDAAAMFSLCSQASTVIRMFARRLNRPIVRRNFRRQGSEDRRDDTETRSDNTVCEGTIPETVPLDSLDPMHDCEGGQGNLSVGIDASNGPNTSEAHFKDLRDEYVVKFHSTEAESEAHNSSTDLYVGQQFQGMYEFKRALRAYAITRRFEYQPVKSGYDKVVARCSSHGCPWMIKARKILGVATFGIKKFIDRHTCNTSVVGRGHRQMTSDFVSEEVHEQVIADEKLTPKMIQTLIQDKYGVTITYWKAYRAWAKAVKEVRGEESSQPSVIEVGTKRKKVHESESREPSVGEVETKRQKQCSKCHGFGHNKRSCDQETSGS